MTGGPPNGAHHGHDHAGDGASDEASWNEWYRARPTMWSGDPNPQLVIEAAELAGGRALDVGSGEGADAIWLAQRGWQVTAVDISTVALERGARQASALGADVGARLTWVAADVTSWVPPASAYDLVSAQFLQLPKEPRDPLFARLAESVAPGGSLLIVGHDPSDLLTTVARPPRPERFFTAPDIASSLDPHTWDIVVSEARPRSTLDPGGQPATIHDAVLRAQRRR